MSAAHAVDAEVRLYDRLFASEDPADEGRDPLTDLNPNSLEIVRGAKVEPALAQATAVAAIPVRAAGLLLGRSGFAAWRARVQPHGDAEGHLGQDRRTRLIVSRSARTRSDHSRN